MVETSEPFSSSFERIKQELDPACSYMIFEKAAVSGEEPGVDAFEQIIDALEESGLNIHEKRFYMDRHRKKVLLVVKFSPAVAERILQKVLEMGLAGDINFYAYSSQFAD